MAPQIPWNPRHIYNNIWCNKCMRLTIVHLTWRGRFGCRLSRDTAYITLILENCFSCQLYFIFNCKFSKSPWNQTYAFDEDLNGLEALQYVHDGRGLPEMFHIVGNHLHIYLLMYIYYHYSCFHIFHLVLLLSWIIISHKGKFPRTKRTNKTTTKKLSRYILFGYYITFTITFYALYITAE